MSLTCRPIAVERVVCLLCACWLANRSLSLKSRRHVNCGGYISNCRHLMHCVGQSELWFWRGTFEGCLPEDRILTGIKKGDTVSRQAPLALLTTEMEREGNKPRSVTTVCVSTENKTRGDRWPYCITQRCLLCLSLLLPLGGLAQYSSKRLSRQPLARCSAL